MRILSLIWLVTGIALMISSGIELWQIGHNSYLGVNSGAFKSTLIASGFSFLCTTGALGLMLKKTWGKIIFLAIAIISFLYSVAYFVMGGFEDTGRFYAIIVAGISLLSIVTIVMLLKKWKYKECKT